MNYIKYTLFPLLLMLTMVLSCENDHGEGDGHEEGEHEHVKNKQEHEEGESEHEEGIFLTQEQIETIGLEFGDFSSIKVNDFVKATGLLGLPPNAHSSVTAKTNGVIRNARKVVEGDYVKKGQIVAYLENQEFIATQQQYLEAKAKLDFGLLEVERQQTLIASNAGVSKNLQNAQSKVSILQAQVKGLEKQLAFLGIATTSLSASNIRQKIAIIAPMSGYISDINFHNGMYVQPTISLMDIISPKHLHLELDVFEQDIAKIQKGQKISYTLPAFGQTIYYGNVEVIGKEFNSDSKTVRVHGHLEEPKPTFIKDLFINAKIYLTDIETTALPEKAIIKDGKDAFIYVASNKDADEVQFKKISVLPSTTEEGYTALKLINPIPEGMQIVTRGAYYIYAQSKAGELSHEH